MKSCENPLSKTEAMSFEDLDLVIDSGDRLNALDSRHLTLFTLHIERERADDVEAVEFDRPRM